MKEHDIVYFTIGLRDWVKGKLIRKIWNKVSTGTSARLIPTWLIAVKFPNGDIMHYLESEARLESDGTQYEKEQTKTEIKAKIQELQKALQELNNEKA